MYTDYRKSFEGLNESDNPRTPTIEACLNYVDSPVREEDNEIFIEVDADGENAYVTLTIANAVKFRDHINTLIEKATYVAPIEVKVDPADPAEYISLSAGEHLGPVSPVYGEKFDFRPQATTWTTFEGSVESVEFDAEATASRINDLWDALVDNHAFEQTTADKLVVAAVRSGLLNP